MRVRERERTAAPGHPPTPMSPRRCRFVAALKPYPGTIGAEPPHKQRSEPPSGRPPDRRQPWAKQSPPSTPQSYSAPLPPAARAAHRRDHRRRRTHGRRRDPRHGHRRGYRHGPSQPARGRPVGQPLRRRPRGGQQRPRPVAPSAHQAATDGSPVGGPVRPGLPEHPRQSEVREDAAIGEPRYGGDLVAPKGENE